MGNRRWARSLVGFTGKVIGCAMLALVVVQADGVKAAWLLMGQVFQRLQPADGLGGLHRSRRTLHGNRL